MAGQNEATVKVSEARAPALCDSSDIDEQSEPLKDGGTPVGSLLSCGSGAFVQGNCHCTDCHSRVTGVPSPRMPAVVQHCHLGESLATVSQTVPKPAATSTVTSSKAFGPSLYLLGFDHTHKLIL